MKSLFCVFEELGDESQWMLLRIEAPGTSCMGVQMILGSPSISKVPLGGNFRTNKPQISKPEPFF